MKIPDRVKVGPFEYTLVHSKSAMDDYNWDNQSSYAGIAEHGNLRITITERRAPSKQKETLVHEVVHAILNTYDLHDRTADEHFVEVFSVALMDTLQRNPDLVSYVVEVDR